jgi:hypothetical protein
MSPAAWDEPFSGVAAGCWAAAGAWAAGVLCAAACSLRVLTGVPALGAAPEEHALSSSATTSAKGNAFRRSRGTRSSRLD